MAVNSVLKSLTGRTKVERKALSTIDFESAKADMGYKNENFNSLLLKPLKWAEANLSVYH